MATLRKLSRSARIIKMALAFPTDDIAERYAKEAKIPLEVACKHALEVKKYLALCAIHPKTSYGMSTVVDGFWHVFIWHTVEYHRFCKLVAGRYIHNHPATMYDKVSGEGRGAYRNLFSAYEKYFGEDAPVEFGPSLLGNACRCRVQDHINFEDGCGASLCR